MATRKKHLINVHTSTGTTAPTAADLRLGEIAVQHTSENPALWIKMGNTESSAVYEKFIGSTEITNMFEDSKILGSGYTYSGIPYVNSSTTIADAYSALTNETILNEKVVAEALNDLNTRIEDLSAATEDIGGIESITMNGNTYTGTSVNLGTVVTAETQLSTAVTGTGNVVTNLTVSGHKITMDKAYSAAPADQFVTLSGAAHNKITSLSAGTIALVGSSAASVFSSAKTYTDSEIGKLDSTGHTSDSGHYLTSITITDGVITAVGEQPVPGETDITTATSGNGNVISNLTVNGHQITMVKGVTAATSAQVSTLSAATHAHVTNGDIHVTAAQKTAWTNGANSGASAYTGVTQLSGVVESLEDEVAKIAVTAVTVSGTGNAVVAATYSDSALTLGKGNVQAVISDLATIRSNAASGMQAYNDVRSLSAATTGISQTLNTVSGAAHNKITALSAATLSAVTAKGDNYIDASVASRSAITVTTKKPVVTDLSAAISATGSLADAKAIKTYIDNTLSSTVTYKGATASLPSNPAVGDMWVAASAFTAGGQSVEVGDFVIARTSGTSAQWDVIEKNLDGAVTGSLTADTVTLGESTNSVKSLANGSNGTVLAISGNKPVWTNAVKVSSASVADNALKVNNHTVSTDVPTGAVFTDTATTEGGHYTPSKSASTEGSATGFIQQIKLDSKNHVVGIVSGSPSDTATTETGHYTPSKSASTEGSTTGFIQQIRLDSKKHVVGIVSGTTSYTETAVTTKNGTTGSTAAPVLSSITTGGTKGHELTLNYTNKVNSATTANSAVTATNAVSATTSLSAKSADDSAKLGGVAAANYSLTSHTHSQYATNETVNTLSSATHTHVTNGDIHVTATQKTNWTNSGTSGANAYVGYIAHSANTGIHVTDAQKTAWTNGANSGASAYTMVQNLSAVTLTGVTAGGTAVPVSNKVAAIPSASTDVFGVVKTGDFLTNTNGTIKVATGTTSSTVARGNHTHSGYATTTNLNALSAATTAHTADTTAHVTAEDKTLWNAAITGVTSAGTGNAFTEYEIAGNLLTLKKGATYLTTAATTTQGGRADSALQYVCGSTYVAVSAKSGANGAKIQTISAKTKGVEASTATGQGLADAYDVKQYVDGIVSSTVAYKGATATLPTASTVGDMYIATAQIPLTAAQSATGAAQTAETGDFIIARAAGKWDVIQKNLDGAVTGSLTADTVTLGAGTHSVKSLANGSNGQVLVISSSKPAWTSATLTDTATTKDGHYDPGFTGTSAGTEAANGFTKAVLLDGKGHVTGTTTGTAITAETKVSVTTNAAGNTAAAVVSGIASGGTLGHTLTVSKTNKIFSASTSDSATTAKSATTAENSVSATTATSAKTSSSAVTTTSAVTSQSASTAADSAKLGGVVAANYSQTSHTHPDYVNQNAFGKIAVGSTTGTASSVTDTLTFSGAGATTVSIDATNRKITISSTDTKVTAVGNHYTATTATKTGGTTTTTAASAVKGITYDNAGHIVGVTTGSVLTGETQLSLGSEYTYSGIPYVNSSTTIADAYSALTNEVLKDERVTSAALNNLNTKVNDLDLRIKELSGNSGGGTLTGVSAGGTEVPVTDDVAAIPSASSSVFGVVKTGSFLTNTNGTISVSTGTTSSTVARGNHTHDEYATTATLNALSAATDTHVGDSDIHVTAQQKGEWNAKQAAIPDLDQIRNNALSGASAYTRVQELSASVIANRDAISALTDSLEELSGAVWSKEFVIAMGMNDLRDKIREISGSTSGGGSGSGLPAVTSEDNGKVLRVENGEWVLTRPVTVYAGTDSPAAALGTEGDIFLQIS